MRKILAITLALLMVLGFAASASAVSWAAPAVGANASPFSVEVVKLGVNADVTGAKYYTVLTDAAAYGFSNIYYAIKLTVPSYADANNYYGNSQFLSGNTVKVTITYTNIFGKTDETVVVPLTDKSQTLWYNGESFDASWTASINTNCGCGNNHILNATVKDTTNASIKVCVGAKGKLSDILIDGFYKVEKKDYYGMKPCANCNPVNLSGFIFSGNCGANKVFFNTDTKGKVTGVYVTGVSGTGNQTSHGAFIKMD